MAIKDKDGSWIDGRGKAVPPSYIDKVDRRRDQTVEQILKKALDLRNRLETFYDEVMEKITDFVVYSSKQSGVVPGGMKGNITLSNFSHNLKVEVQNYEYLDFDERLHQAKQLIDSCMKRWSEGSRKEIRTIINQAFEVDQKGKLNVKAILNLRKIKIRDREWELAMELIDEARSVVFSKSYARFFVRGEDGAWNSVVLDLANVPTRRNR
jgi:Rad3-related DNA helicase